MDREGVVSHFVLAGCVWQGRWYLCRQPWCKARAPAAASSGQGGEQLGKGGTGATAQSQRGSE